VTLLYVVSADPFPLARPSARDFGPTAWWWWWWWWVQHNTKMQTRFCSKLKLNNEVTNLSIEIANKAAPFLEGKSPSSIAATAILMASKQQGDRRQEKDIAAAASISATTIRNVYKELLPHMQTILPEGYHPIE